VTHIRRTATSVIENGFVYLPTEAVWLADYLHELAAFPDGKHDDQADSTSQALDWAKESMYPLPLFEYIRQESRRLGLPISPSVLDDDLLTYESIPAVCPECRNGGPAQHGRTYHCNQCGYEWKDVRDPNADLLRCSLPGGELLICDEGRSLWVDVVRWGTYPPVEPE
jgi:putative hemolysin